MLGPISAIAALPLASASLLKPQIRCSDLASVDLKSYHGSFLNATYYAEGSRNVTGAFNKVGFCEVNADISYGNNDSLHFATWLPDTYQDRFMAVGNGGMAGTIDISGMLVQLNNGLGMAVAGGDAGHLAIDNQNITGYLPYLHDKQQVQAWIHDAISLLTPAAQTLVKAYYGKQPEKSYYYGCSTGGAQGFALAQSHPELFDGIYAGSPGNWYSHLALSFLWNAQHAAKELNYLTDAVLNACDDIDGVTDRLIENPLACKFDIDSLACSSPSSSSSSSSNSTCLTEAKIESVKAFYAGPKREDTGAQVYPGFSFGSEIGWAAQQGNLSSDFSVPILKNLVFDDQGYDNATFNWSSDVDILDERAGRLIDSITPDLSAFKSRNGKLLISQGWADQLNAATWPIEHRNQIKSAMGGSVDDFYRLVMIPGGGHCGANPDYPTVPGTYSFIAPLVEWVESDGLEAPTQFLSTAPPSGGNRTRKLCVWPAVAKYRGGDVGDWTSYECAE
ncbi:hypothetical protein CERZMDRAFT_81835 [Cercospora zeae-maydis SCOH1-5]|uniref:Carboxylic ester hydrolase n=1 Tax=Cercospora zeae-maydis SCOH1-5 TaxID=717836 RepID=A0A6A6FQG7_9PEZI|nr:hypothetical protein CERZMDRAFT_81835 [Cercospora zeae-maydis SCOH1-5]